MARKKTSPPGFIVIYDNEDGFVSPYGWDDDCEGAISCFGDTVAMFPDRKSALKAIRISTAFAKLNKAQGKPTNIDFIDPPFRIKIVPLVQQRQDVPSDKTKGHG